MVPSEAKKQKHKNEKPHLIPTLIPFIDLANHDHLDNGSGSIYFDAMTNMINLQLHKSYEVGNELLIYYGVRSNLRYRLDI